MELSRTKLHELAFICIFEHLFYKNNDSYKKPIEEIISDVMEMPYDNCDPFFKALIFETIKNEEKYKELVQDRLDNWTFDRLCLSDQAILLLFTSEILNNRAQIQVIIDVAVDLAHRYCDEKSYKYINKVLDRIYKEVYGN